VLGAHRGHGPAPLTAERRANSQTGRHEDLLVLVAADDPKFRTCRFRLENRRLPLPR
jgi:hypothetical protein